ncbi:uncharacterized protein [Parasteatoda tepidariorum]|uniref:uncharacterized protein n=1 Tax=Parasteatoda tepidariorum TaxID=114398 RepID=UPI0039BCE777
MSPNSSGAVNCRRDISIRNPKSLSVKYQPTDISMKRAGPSGAGSTIPLATERSEFEDFMNAYRPNLETARREFEPQPKPAEESKVDFGRSIKKLMKRPTNSPSTQKSIRKEGFTRTPTLAIPNHPERERSVTSDGKPMSEKKTKRPLSATIETFAPPASAPGPTTLQPPNAILPKTEITPPPSPLPPPPPKAPKPPVKSPKNGLEDLPKALPESAPVLPASVPPPLVPVSIPAHVKKKVSIQEDKRRSGTDVFGDAFCLIITGNNIGRFLPSRHVRRIPILQTVLNAYQSAISGTTTSFVKHLFFKVMQREVQRELKIENSVFPEFPFATYLVVNGGRNDVAQKMQALNSSPSPDRGRQLHFTAAYEEAITISRPPPCTFPEKPSSDKTGFVMCLYQVLPGEDGAKFEQNWVMWTGARQLYRTVPQYMGLKRISVHKSILPTKIINYCVMCEFSNIMDHLTDACVVIDHLRARCCGFIGIFRVLDSL